MKLIENIFSIKNEKSKKIVHLFGFKIKMSRFSLKKIKLEKDKPVFLRN